MAKIFERITETGMRWYDGLSDRERRLMVILFTTIFIVLVFFTVFFAANKLSVKRSMLLRQKQQLSEIVALEDDFLRAKEKSEKAKLSVQKNNISLFTFIQNATSRLGLSVKDLTEQRRTLPKSNIVEVSVKLNLTKLSIDRVTALIEAIEGSENKELVKITKLKINKRFDEPELLDLQMTISTWKSA